VRLPAFDYQQPGDLNDALDLLNIHGSDCKILAGGTDLLVRMKQGLAGSEVVMSLKALPDLSYIHRQGDWVCMGAATPLADVISADLVCDNFPGLVEAVASIGAPSIQHYRGTIGGNLCQDNRCQFYNQSAFFRGARQACHKAGGQTCYARQGGSDRCHSICQSDAAPILTALNAEVVLRRKGSERTIPLVEFYSAHGEYPFTLAADELLTEIRIPKPTSGSGSAYERLAFRSAIDYPVVCVGVDVQISAEKFENVRIVVGAIGTAPLVVATAAGALAGKRLDDTTAVDQAAKAVRSIAEAFVAHNVSAPADYRVRMAGVLAKRALERAIQRAC
jgi:4-hydroxybenzoyl-CoA reductase subunit beta